MIPRHFQALGRLKPGAMNKTEAEYAGMLEARKRAGELAWWAFEPFKIRLADRTFYDVDFGVMLWKTIRFVVSGLSFRMAQI